MVALQEVLEAIDPNWPMQATTWNEDADMVLRAGLLLSNARHPADRSTRNGCNSRLGSLESGG
jgi:hypothetical protein